MTPPLITTCIVEDNKDIRESLMALINQSVECTCLGSFETAETALEQIPVLHPNIVLMDIDLPGISGIECIRQLKPLYPEIQFMICSVYDEDEKIFDALTAGATAYILKRSGDGMIEAIKELFAGGSPMSSDIARKIVMNFQKNNTTGKEQFDLTKREIEVLKLLAKGCSYQQAADNIYISPKTIKKHIYNIYDKLHVNSRTEAVNKYFGLNR
jgi:two-component system, NarL family, response regulator LiaR